MSIRPFEGKLPQIAPEAYVDAAATVIGDVTIGAGASLWPGVVARGDIHRIEIGARTNIQDGSILHVTHDSEFAPGGHPLIIGAGVTVGHRVVLHACAVGDFCLVGMGSIVLDGAVLEPRVLLGAGSVVAPGKQLEGGYLWLGTPARCVRPLTDAEQAYLDYSANYYAELGQRHRTGI
jgi:carbonic anhydrase/acetyltransferase-like protein (isoleucine patch superfamily)